MLLGCDICPYDMDRVSIVFKAKNFKILGMDFHENQPNAVTNQYPYMSQESFWSRLRYQIIIFLEVENLRFTWIGYSDDVIGHFRIQ